MLFKVYLHIAQTGLGLGLLSAAKGVAKGGA